MRHLFLLLCLLLLPACRSSSKEADGGDVAAAPRQTATLAPTRALTPSTVAVGASETPGPVRTPSPVSALPPSERLAAAREAEHVGEWERAISLYESLRADNEQGGEVLLLLGISTCATSAPLTPQPRGVRRFCASRTARRLLPYAIGWRVGLRRLVSTRGPLSYGSR